MKGIIFTKKVRKVWSPKSVWLYFSWFRHTLYNYGSLHRSQSSVLGGNTQRAIYIVSYFVELKRTTSYPEKQLKQKCCKKSNKMVNNIVGLVQQGRSK